MGQQHVVGNNIWRNSICKPRRPYAVAACVGGWVGERGDGVGVNGGWGGGWGGIWGGFEAHTQPEPRCDPRKRDHSGPTTLTINTPLR